MAAAIETVTMPRMKYLAALSACLLSMAAPATADDLCAAAAHRVFGFLKAEAKGTRHEEQIAKTIDEKGEGMAMAELATRLNSDQCAILVAAPDSTVRALAISMLPERNGQ